MGRLFNIVLGKEIFASIAILVCPLRQGSRTSQIRLLIVVNAGLAEVCATLTISVYLLVGEVYGRNFAVATLTRRLRYGSFVFVRSSLRRASRLTTTTHLPSLRKSLLEVFKANHDDAEIVERLITHRLDQQLVYAVSAHLM